MSPKNQTLQIELGPDHKVVVVLDHGPRLGVQASEQIPIHVKELTGNKQRLAATTTKLVWSLAAECAIEMHRVVSDVFPNSHKLMRFVLSSYVGRFLTSGSDVMKKWTDTLISRQEVRDSVKTAGTPTSGEDSSILNGVRMAVDALTEKTTAYRKAMDAAQQAANRLGRGIRPRVPIPQRKTTAEYGKQRKKESSPIKALPNQGAVVIITVLKTEDELNSLETEIVEIVKGRNSVVNNLGDDDSFLQIDHLYCYIINIYNKNEKEPFINRPMKEVDDKQLVNIRVFSCPDNGVALRAACHALTLDLYNLVSTTVTGIPMKEENIAGQSTNYDVELFHPKRVFGQLEKHKLLAPDSHLLTSNGVYSTVKLHWATPNPKTKWDLFPHTSVESRVSLADFNSRQSVCLSTFLMSGRHVMLEVSKQGVAEQISPNVGNKLVSHTLSAASGRIHIHEAIMVKQEVVTDEEVQKKAELPTVSEARIDDFKELMKEATLTVKNIEKKTEKEQKSLAVANDSALVLLNRITRFWPLHRDDTVLYNLQEKFKHFFQILRKPELTNEDFAQAKECIFEFVGQKDNPPYANNENSGKAPKTLSNKSEQFQTVAQELVLHLGNYVNHSELHLELFNLLVQLTGTDRTLSVPTSDVDIGAKRKCISSASEAQKWYGGGGGSGGSTPRASSRSNSPQPKRAYKEKYSWKPGETLKVGNWLLQMDQQKYWSKWRDFEGRIIAGDQPAKLYPDLDIAQHPNKKTEIPQG